MHHNPQQTARMPSASALQSKCSVRSLIPFLLLFDFWSTTAFYLAYAGVDTRGFGSSIWHQFTQYSFSTSMADVFLISCFKGIYMYAAVLYLEFMIKRETRDPLASSSRNTVFYYTVFSLTASVGFIAVSAAKFIVSKKEGSFETVPPAVVKSFLIVFLVFNVIWTFLSLLAVRYIRQLKQICGGYLAVFSAYEALDEADERDGETKSLLSKESKKEDINGSKKYKKSSIIRVLRLAGPELWILLPAFICLLVGNITNLAVPTFFGRVVDTVGEHKDKDGFRDNILTLMVIFAVTGFASFFQSFLFQLAGQRILARLRMRVFSSIIHQDIEFFDLSHTGELINRLASDTAAVQTVVTTNLTMLTKNSVQVIGALCVMFYYSWRLTSVILGVVPVIAIGAVVYGRQVRGLRKRFQDTLAKASKVAEETIGSVRTVRAFANEDKAADDYNAAITDSFGIGVKTALAAGSFIGGVSFLAQGAIVLVLWYGGTLVLDGQITPGRLTTFMLYTLTTAIAIGTLSSIYGDLMQAVGASERLFDLLDSKPLIEPRFGTEMTNPETRSPAMVSSVYGTLSTPPPTSPASPSLSYPTTRTPTPTHMTITQTHTNANTNTHTTVGESWRQISVPTVRSRAQPVRKLLGNIEFRNVVFSYPSRRDVKVIDGISLTVAKGSVVALVGPSGGGKSTLISLLERFYDPCEGEILVDGLDIRSFHPHEYRRQLALVGQEPVLFATTINENIAYGLDNVKQEDIIQAAMKANAHNFIMEFPDGYETAVGERGVKLSGGQKQRIAIARALLLDPAVLLLDEATSALDAESEHLVQEAIDRMLEGRTVMIVAHRLSTIRNADLVFVINGGIVAEQGTHEDLINLDGIYKNLVRRQMNEGGGDTIIND
eukprot:CFRG7566T1